MSETREDLLARYRDCPPELVLLNESQQAALLGVHKGTLQNWRSRGTCPLKYVRISGGAVRYRLSDTLAYLEAVTRTHTDGG